MTSKAQAHLKLMQDIYKISTHHGFKTFIWGGYAVDILHGQLTREHSDLDCFTESLAENKDILTSAYEAQGYTVKYLEDFWMLIIEKDGVSATFNSVRNIDNIAHWHHAGLHGTVFFPYEWLDNEPRLFYGVPAYSIGVELAYLLKTNVKLISAEWQMREKDRADAAILEQILVSKGICKNEIRKKVWSHNPYWYAKGYAEYYYPITLT